MQQESVVTTNVAGQQSGPVIAKLASGGWVVVWQTDTNSLDLRGQIYDANGGKTGGEFAVNAVTAAAQGAPAVAGMADDGFIVAWADARSDAADIVRNGFRAPDRWWARSPG